MTRLASFLCCLLLIPFAGYGQLTISRDEKGQIFTSEEIYGPGTINATAHRKLTYVGSPFLTFPVWQPGTIKLDEEGQEISCQLAYDLVYNRLMCRFTSDSAVSLVRPERFTIGGEAFVRQPGVLIGTNYRGYTKILHDGKTKLLLSMSKRIDPSYAVNNNGYARETTIDGGYVLIENYYVRKGNAEPELITLTRNGVLSVLHEQAHKLAPRLTNRRLSAADVAAVLPYYDSLMAVDWATRPVVGSAQDAPAPYVLNKAPLSNDPVFTQALHQRIQYPEIAWTRAVYGRVYVGFEVDSQGKARNIVILSPENVGMGFTEAVRNGLENLPDLDPAFTGTYALPVAFTYANRSEKAKAHTPVNRLPEERLSDRTLLEEFVVPVVVTKPVTTSREVWGYYSSQPR